METKAADRDVTKRCDFEVLVLISDWTITVENICSAVYRSGQRADSGEITF